MISCQKHLFSLAEDVSYLNNAYRGPVLKSSEQAALEDLQSMRNPQTIAADDFFKGVKKVKGLFSQLIGAATDEVAIIPSTSYGFAVALSNWKVVKGKKAITVEDEFPSGYFSINRWANENEATLEVIKRPDNSDSKNETWNQNVLRAIDENTAVVLLSSVHWMSGCRYDLEAIGAKCKEVGACFIVDGTQSVGAMPIDVKACQIDALICATYKWLLGPYSLGIAYFSSTFDQGKPLEESWMNRTNSQTFSSLTDYQEKYLPQANRFDVGETSHFVLMPMLEQSLSQILEWTPEMIQTYDLELKRTLSNFQDSICLGMDMSSFSCNHLFELPLKEGLNPLDLKEVLEQEKIYVSVRGKALRVSINLFNSQDDIDRLIKVLLRF